MQGIIGIFLGKSYRVGERGMGEACVEEKVVWLLDDVAFGILGDHCLFI